MGKDHYREIQQNQEDLPAMQNHPESVAPRKGCANLNPCAHCRARESEGLCKKKTQS